MTTQTDEVTEALPAVDDDVSDFDGMAHYVRAKSLVHNNVVVALCGKKWDPRTRGAAVMDLPVCAVCESLFGLIQAMDKD